MYVYIYTGFRYTYPSEESDFVSWDIIIIFPIYGQSTNSMVPDHQSAIPLPKNRRASKILHKLIQQIPVVGHRRASNSPTNSGCRPPQSQKRE